MSFAAGGFSLDHRNCQHMANGSEGTDNAFTNDVYLEVVMLTDRKNQQFVECGGMETVLNTKTTWLVREGQPRAVSLRHNNRKTQDAFYLCQFKLCSCKTDL
ncbi:MAG: hypothetical protein PHQ65_13635 [Bacteroidales bacterium]|nr:hypothetical protein [Bacteroidales bacterium]MDD3666300.1 hypothetical protein [Bacteroidales bacterium]